jgi:hypothetical protein
MPVWEEDIGFDALELTAAECEFGSVNNASARGNRNSERRYSPLNEAPGSGDGSSETDQDDLESIGHPRIGSRADGVTDATTHG